MLLKVECLSLLRASSCKVPAGLQLLATPALPLLVLKFLNEVNVDPALLSVVAGPG
jgi:hypothetical protein